MKNTCKDFNPFNVTNTALIEGMRKLAYEKAFVLNLPGQRIVSSLSGVPLEDLARFSETGEIERRYIPVLYKFSYGNQHPQEVGKW